MPGTYKLLLGHAYEQLKTIPENTVDCCVTSPPYYNVRDYGIEEQLGREENFHDFIQNLVDIFMEIHRIMKPTGTLWINIGDSYASAGGFRMPRKDNMGDKFDKSRNRTKQSRASGNFMLCNTVQHGVELKNLLGIPWRLALQLQEKGWYIRSEIIWYKPNNAPESVVDRPMKTHENIFFLTKNPKYYYNLEAAKRTKFTNGYMDDKKSLLFDEEKNLRTVWTIPTFPQRDIPHIAMFPELLVETCIKLGTPEDGTVIDPFTGSGTTGIVALKNDFNFIGCELNPEYFQIAEKRLSATQRKRKKEFF